MTGTPRLVIAGTHSGVGKTTITTALLAAFTRRGLKVQPFKAGPDFLDPTYHRAATGRASRNLDGWMLSRETNAEIFQRAAADADLAIVEGMMGLFDGREAASEAGSTAEIAKWLEAPVVLIVDAAGMARSAAAAVKGFETFDAGLHLAGVIFNRVAGAGHFEYLRDSVAANCSSEVLGFAPPRDRVQFPDRHLGLVPAEEVVTAERLTALADWIEATVNLDALLALAGRAAFLPAANAKPSARKSAAPVRIGIARDRAFCFYYQDNLDLLEQCGAELIEFSPLSDDRLPDGLDGIYLGGGYPEIHAANLAANKRMRSSVREFCRSGAPVYAECGGFMYLSAAIVDNDGREHPMAGVFPTRARMQPRLAALGYVEVEQIADVAWLRAGERVRGHEFRYSHIDDMPESVPRGYRVTSRTTTKTEGFVAGRTLASYIHLHFGSCADFPARFVAACLHRQSNREMKIQI